MSDPFDIAVVGNGIAGLVAAREAAAAGVSVVHVMGADVMGGLVANVGELEEFSGGPVAGIDLATTLFTDASEHGVVLVPEYATLVEPCDGGFRLIAGEDEIRARAVVLASGARLKPLDVPGALDLEHRGVSQCGWCDGPLYRDESVVVVGGGDAAAREALHLAGIASHVTMLVRGATLKARAALAEQIAGHKRVRVRANVDVVEIQGDEAVSGVIVKPRDGGPTDRIATRGVFVFVGLEPNTSMLPENVARDAKGAVVTNDRLETSLQGLLAVGAVRSGYSGQLDDAIDEARRAVDLLLRSQD
jgi:thioredoxin reductase (NADPH)